jgi:hypothetical protein
MSKFALTPRSPDRIDASVQVQIDTNQIYLSSQNSNYGGCLLLSRIKCALRYNTARQAPDADLMLATLQFSIDTKWDKLLSFRLTELGGTEVCGGSAPAAPACLQPEDVDLSGENTCGNIWCGAADLNFVKSAVLKQMAPTLKAQLETAIRNQSCEACGPNLKACPQLSGAASVCQGGLCLDAADKNRCVPRFLGIEGRLALETLLGGMGVPSGSAIELSVAAGSSVSVDQGLNIGMRAGLEQTSTSACVATAPPPAARALPPPKFDAQAPRPRPTADGGVLEYSAAIGISSDFLNTLLHSAHQAGALCLEISTQNAAVLTTGLFKTILPSLGNIATRDGQDAPMRVVLRPSRRPELEVGEGTYDPQTKKPLRPLLKLSIPDLSFDFYALIEDRYVRLFSLTADLSVPLSLVAEGCDTVTPAVGDPKEFVANIRTGDSELLAEDPEVLKELVPVVLGLAEPSIAASLKPVTLPAFGPFKLRMLSAKGLDARANGAQYEHLGLYAALMPATAACSVIAPRVSASLERALMPDVAAMRARAGKPLPLPEAVLRVGVTGLEATAVVSTDAEFSWKVDEGLWSDFVPVPDGELRVVHPGFILQGAHTIWVRARSREALAGISAPVAVGFVVDWSPPDVAVRVDRLHDRLVIEAHDLVSQNAALEFAYRVGEGAYSEFGPAREILLSAVEVQGGVGVRVRDASGNVAMAQWRAPTTASRRVGHVDDPAGAAPSAGCSSVPGGAAVGLLVLVWSMLRSGRRCR